MNFIFQILPNQLNRNCSSIHIVLCAGLGNPYVYAETILAHRNGPSVIGTKSVQRTIVRITRRSSLDRGLKSRTIRVATAAANDAAFAWPAKTGSNLGTVSGGVHIFCFCVSKIITVQIIVKR